MRGRERNYLASLLLGVALLPCVAGVAFAHGAKDDDDDKPGANGVEAAEGVETENIFGFTLGTDTGEKGEKEVSFTVNGSLGKLGGHYGAYSGEAEFEYSITDNLKFAIGGALAGFDISGVPGIDNIRSGGLGGAFFEVKYRFLDHRTSPIGLSLSIEPEWSRLDETTGEQGTAYGIEFRLAADAEIVPNFLFAAVNLVYQPEWEREHEDGISFWSAGSGLELSGALTAQVAKDVFLGGEMRYLTAYDGATLGDRQGWGLFVGPTLYAQVTPQF